MCAALRAFALGLTVSVLVGCATPYDKMQQEVRHINEAHAKLGDVYPYKQSIYYRTRDLVGYIAHIEKQKIEKQAQEDAKTAELKARYEQHIPALLSEVRKCTSQDVPTYDVEGYVRGCYNSLPSSYHQPIDEYVKHIEMKRGYVVYGGEDDTSKAAISFVDDILAPVTAEVTVVARKAQQDRWAVEEKEERAELARQRVIAQRAAKAAYEKSLRSLVE